MQTTDDPNGALNSLLRKRFQEKYVEELEKLLERGADPNLQTGGRPALIKCIDRGYPPRAVKMLLTRGADSNGQNGKRAYSRLGDGGTALARAACSVFSAHRKAWVGSLLNHGAEVNLRDLQGHTVVDHLLEVLRCEIAMGYWSETSMDKIRIAWTVRSFFNTVQPIFQTLDVLLEKGARPGSLSALEFNKRMHHIEEHWNESTRWLVAYNQLAHSRRTRSAQQPALTAT